MRYFWACGVAGTEASVPLTAAEVCLRLFVVRRRRERRMQEDSVFEGRLWIDYLLDIECARVGLV